MPVILRCGGDWMSQIDLYCLPYAGGSANAIYRKWAQQLDEVINIIPLELAGHGRRMSEPFHHSIEAIVDDILNTIREQLMTNRPYALYAHSMGTVIAYELVTAIKSAGLPQPCTLFLSGRQPVHHKYPDRNIHLLPDDDFLEEIKRIGGTPDQLFESEALISIFLPILRQDYRLIEKYRFKEPVITFDSDIIFLCSDRDLLVSKPGIFEWERYTTKFFKVYDFEGGHFFLNESWQEIVMLINRYLVKHETITDSNQ